MNKITTKKEAREAEAHDLLLTTFTELPEKVEHRDIDGKVGRLREILDKDDKARTSVETEILSTKKKLLVGTDQSKHITRLSKGLSRLATLATLIEAIVLYALDLKGEPWYVVALSVSLLAMSVLAIMADTAEELYKKFREKKTDLEAIQWKPKKKLAKVVSFLEGVVGLKHTDPNTTPSDELSSLSRAVLELPAHVEGVQLLDKKEHYYSALLLSLPPDHPIRIKLRQMEEYAKREEEWTDLVPRDLEEEDELEEPDFIMTETPRFGEFCQRKLQTPRFEQGIKDPTSSSSSNPTRKKLDQGIIERIKPEYEACNSWCEMEKALGVPLKKLTLQDGTVKKERVFRTVQYGEFKEKFLEPKQWKEKS